MTHVSIGQLGRRLVELIYDYDKSATLVVKAPHTKGAPQ